MSILLRPIGVCHLYFDNLYLGKTVDSVKVTPEQNEKEIMAAQNGTKPDDYATTGVQWIVEAKIKDLTVQKLQKLLPGLIPSGDLTSWLHGHQHLFQSHRDNYAKELRVVLHDSLTCLPSIDPEFKFIIPLASPLITGFKEFGADIQTTLDVTFRSLYDPRICGHIYSGYASSLGISG